MQQYTVYLCLQNALHVPGGISTHHQGSHHCIYSVWHYWGTIPIQPRSWQVAVTVSIMPVTVDTVIWAPDNGCRYHPKHVEQFADINKLHIVASFWIIIDTNWWPVCGSVITVDRLYLWHWCFQSLANHYLGRDIIN